MTRKKSLLLNNVLGILGALFMGLAKPCNSFEMIIVGRFIIGLNCGLNSGKSYHLIIFTPKHLINSVYKGLCPMYITEIAPLEIRGSVGTLFQ